MTPLQETIDHSSSRPASLRPSSESYVAHLRNVSRLSFDSEILDISPASLSPPSTPRPGSPIHHHAPIYDPYMPAAAMVCLPASHPSTPATSSGRNTPIVVVSPPPSRPLTPGATTPYTDPEKPPVAISPSTRPPPRRSYEVDPFEHRTRWSMAKPKHQGESGYCFGTCDEPPTMLSLCGSWVTGVGTMLLAGASMTCCAAALR